MSVLVKVNDMPATSTFSSTDLFMVADGTTGITKKITGADMRAALGSGGSTPLLFISGQPQGAAVPPGETKTLSVTVINAVGSPTYQWFFNGTAISGATSSTYAVTTFASGKAGAYHVVVTASNGTATSDDANLILAVRFLYGFITSGIPTEAQINAGNTIWAAPGSNVTVASFGNTTDAVCFLAEASTEPVKTAWYMNSFINGAIGSGQVFLSGAVAAFKVFYNAYATNFPTLVNFNN